MKVEILEKKEHWPTRALCREWTATDVCNRQRITTAVIVTLDLHTLRLRAHQHSQQTVQIFPHLHAKLIVLFRTGRMSG